MDLKRYIYGHCVSPVKVSVYDPYERTKVVRELPCGHCLHCKNTHINDWVTRLYAQDKYSKHTYFITLDYAPFTDSTPSNLIYETAATYHNINKNCKFGLHPLLLVRNHLQDYLKRFRKNTGIKIQYFACGEYGMHAEGRGYGRPHFHLIVFSNKPISKKQFSDAWCVGGYQIGRVDFHDLKQNGTSSENNSFYQNKYVFKYVCKYLQKADFEFDKLATIDFHRKYFESMQKVIINADSLFPEETAITDSRVLQRNWSEYVSKYSPFTCCSKRPSIGFEYLKENLSRFEKRDFRLFGLSEECTVFPKYFVRKTKESLCPVFAVGEVSQKPSSSARVGYILSVLSEILYSRCSSENFGEKYADIWYFNKETGKLEHWKRDMLVARLVLSDLYMYDCIDKIFFQFNGYNYNLWQSDRGVFHYVGCMEIETVITCISKIWDKYFNDYVIPMHAARLILEQEFEDMILTNYPHLCRKDALEQFAKDSYSYYVSEATTNYKTKLLTQNSKISL